MLEPDDADRFITKVYFEEHKFDADVKFVSTSGEFFDFMENTDRTKLPSLILLNMHAVPLNASGILKSLKSATKWNHIPVVILSESKDPKMIRECYELGASSFIQKPDTESETNKKIMNFIKYWFETVELV
ncbi:MAG: response regulator receiver protein [Bacteroidota bacterium]|nr:response regulator receiver protein [Bacteroidota bacterium]